MCRGAVACMTDSCSGVHDRLMQWRAGQADAVAYRRDWDSGVQERLMQWRPGQADAVVCMTG